jgi:beta-mannanase
VWCPNIDPNTNWGALDQPYPGDSYVDWTCLDVYNGNTR